MASSLFISDLHLSEERPSANEAFFAFIEEKASRAAALYVLGDLFEYWIGDDDLEDPFNAVIAGFLSNLGKSGVPVYVLHGNRDFLIGERFATATGAHLMQDPSRADLPGGPALLLHGDTLCTDDTDYQAWRQTARSEAWQADFLAHDLPERRQIILGLREKSRTVIQAKPAEIMDVNDAAVQQAFREHAVRRMIHGHTHRPGRHAYQLDGQACERWVLPDWYGPGGYLEVDESGTPRLVSFA